MTTKPISKESFVEFLKTNYSECFENGTPITENALESLVILKKREYAKQFCASLSKDVMQVKTNKKFKDQLKDIEYKIRKNHIDLGENYVVS